ncbi:MAG: ribosome silencing factor [Candidatus Paceibacterota bacterium]
MINRLIKTVDNTRTFAVKCARLASTKKADDISVLNMAKTSLGVTDYFVICSGNNKKQNQAIADEFMMSLKGRILGIEGYEQGNWIVVDLNSVVVHIFHESLRKFYDLEFLWSDVPRVRLPKL